MRTNPKHSIFDTKIDPAEFRRRLLSKTVIPPDPNGCWAWVGCTANKYGRLYGPRPARYILGAHRVSYEVFHGKRIPVGMCIDHLCRNTRCVNPAHLEVVTMVENVLRGNGLSATAKRRNHCAKGHEYTPENTRITRGRRYCRECCRQFARKYAQNGKRITA